MINKILYVLLLFSFLSCDTKKEFSQNLSLEILCYTLAACNGQTPSRIGMVGDSWTDLLAGYPFVETLRVQLEKYHGYQVVGATLGGRTLQDAINQGLHYQVIDQAGPQISVIFLSLGGNDLLTDVNLYFNRVDAERSKRIALLKTQLKNMVDTGNAYKISKYGGNTLKWVIHGYDYSNPFMPQLSPTITYGCKASFTNAGFTESEVPSITQGTLDQFNAMLKKMSTEDTNFIYLDLRRTLGGPPISASVNMLDCIHPNDLGFRILGNQISTFISPITGVTK
ncbi:GDSL-like protein [Leptospira ryugenii]|uniref:GDSL-like protein n=1 Tax=Leptospira ryugenii TaxID=1917863 RepID=A0A2P2E3C8_9LEPT|nr:SGNH/GDSL hydrolase family protein [Leptospira ryugenii]GBF51371.1 GDSL-like protein [Leptospira ryugenii]